MMTGTKPYETSLRLTKTASEKMRGFGIRERSFFMADQAFRVFLERYPKTADGSLSVAIVFAQEETERLAEQALGGLVTLHCVFANHQLLATNVTLRKAQQAHGTNWQREERLRLNDSRSPVPVAFVNLINRMTPAKERSEYVKKRISSWEGYLKIQEQGMDIPDIKSGYSNIAFSHDFSRITLNGCRMEDNEWKNLRNLSVRLAGIEGDVGTVLKAKNRTIEVELNPYIIKQLREKGHALPKREVVFSNFAALSQIRRLRQGFTNLEKGLAINPKLDRLLFEEQPDVSPLQPAEKLTFHNRLNEFQQQAVSGAIAAEDLYVIQGPPGTGKTTVISEICLQNAKKGLRTLVASQSNLAVDNALGRLLAHKDIRILRVGRTESIEEDGKKFIEENVGQYWRDHTLKEVRAQYDARHKRGMEIERQLEEAERESTELTPRFEQLKQAVQEKEHAQQRSRILKESIAHVQKKRTAIESRITESTNEHEALMTRCDALGEQIRQLKTLAESGKTAGWFQGEKLRVKEAIAELERGQESVKLTEQQNELQEELDEIALKRTDVQTVLEGKRCVSESVDGMKKIEPLLRLMTEQNVEEVPGISFSLSKLDMIRNKMAERRKLEAANKSLNSAIAFVEKLLAPAGIALQELKDKALQQEHSYTAGEIDEYLEKLRKLLKNTKSIDPAILTKALGGLYRRKSDVWRKAALLKSVELYIEETKRAFAQLKKTVAAELMKQQQQFLELDEQWLQVEEKKQQELTRLGEQIRQLKVVGEVPEDIPAAIETKRAELEQLAIDEAAVVEAAERLLDLDKERERELEKREAARKRLESVAAEMQEAEALLAEKEREAASLESVLAQNPEAAYEETAKRMASLSFSKQSLSTEKESLPLMQAVQKQWLGLLESASEHDLDEIRKLYIKHANVIGTTCVASARKDFQDNYPEFDVVIIDEVSKATPPELLLPMLKGKKIILVGDHHQLPPLLGNDTLEETLEEMIKDGSNAVEKRELEKLLEESLFERLYKNLPPANKTMLAIQYRMHEDIMETIAPFYRFDKATLQCGLENSDSERDHFLESVSIKRSNHLMWLDLPNEPAYFEERMSGGKSLYNPSELAEISSLLVEMNGAVEDAKRAGRMAPDELKTVGVISFYGEQVKRLQRMIDQELHVPHLVIRTGTVDRFQGSEMEIILLSMVRNNQNERGDIGFANDYRRLNVALSRAKQLLVLVGSSDMFTKRAKKEQTKRMYRHVRDVAKQKNGLKLLQKG